MPNDTPKDVASGRSKDVASGRSKDVASERSNDSPKDCPNTAVDFCGVTFKNPVVTASGTFGYGEVYEDFVDLNDLGGVIVKGVSATPWQGNKTPRIAETACGMLNAIGLQNPGLDYFKQHYLPYLAKFDTNVIVNICGHTIEDYVQVAKGLNDTSVAMLELNVSCPNVDKGGISFGTDAAVLRSITKEVKAATNKPLIVKLSPNVTDICAMAQAAKEGGADGLSLINTLIGMKINIETKTFALANKKGGLSGPCIKPVAVRMVYEVARVVDLPIIGMGGIVNGDDAVEFLLAGASLVAVGTGNFVNPTATTDTAAAIKAYLSRHNIDDVNTLKTLVN